MRRESEKEIVQRMKRLLSVASGTEPADLAFRNVRVVQVLTGEVLRADVLVRDGYIAAVVPAGEHDTCPSGDPACVEKSTAREEIDLAGRFLCPGFIDSHVHIESSMVSPCEFARSVLPHGTTAVIADPHEIANVSGLAGIQYMLDEAARTPLDLYLTLPSCVPATPFEHAGAALSAADLTPLFDDARVLGLGEMMNFPGVLAGDDDVLDKIAAARIRELVVDGHSPGLGGRGLGMYALTGISTDHECTTPEEALDRLRLGMSVLLREGSAARNVTALLPAVMPAVLDRCLFCTDDRNPGDILRTGHIDNNLRIAVAGGLDPVSAIRMATLNAARHYGLTGSGAIAPGWIADLVVLEDLKDFQVRAVFRRGVKVAEEGRALFESHPADPGMLKGSVRMAARKEGCLQLQARDGMPVIGLRPRSLLTDFLRLDVRCSDGRYRTTEGDPLLKLAVLERHHATGHIAVALAAGLGLTRGAIASTVAHDSHNLIVIGCSDTDMLCAVDALEACGGGIATAEGGKCTGLLPLPIAGLMSDRPLEEVNETFLRMQQLAREMGVLPEHDPFMTLAFLALPVIPELKLTDMGLFDVSHFSFVLE